MGNILYRFALYKLELFKYEPTPKTDIFHKIGYFG